MREPMNSETPQEDNLASAIDAVAEDMSLTRSRKVAKKGETAQEQVLFRATTEDHERWKKTAERLGISMAEFMRVAANEKATKELECQHPLAFRKSYPWMEECLKCGVRLRDGDGKTYIR